MPIYKDSVRKARESVLKEDLWIMRDAIDQHFTDKGYYPSDLSALVDTKYIRQIPVDPITGSADTWVTEDAEATDETMPDQPSGIINVRSGAEGTTIDGIAYSDL
jgi:general secretion pathway protein G